MDDHEEIADLEHRLYAQIHYSCGGEDDELASSNGNGSILPTVSNQNAVNNVRNSGQPSSKSKARYWSDDRGGNTGPQQQQQQQRYNGKRPNPNTTERSKPKPATTIVENNVNLDNPPGKRPKPFTPYTPLLSETGTTSTISNIEPSVSKQPNEKKESDNRSSKCINPFNKLRERHRKQKEKYEAKKKRADKNRKNVLAPIPPVVAPLADAQMDDDDDDDVVIIPTEPPPLICIDDSSEEEVLVECEPIDAYRFIAPEKRNYANALGGQPGSSRCVSPTSSIVSDDFIGHRDRQRVELDAFGGVADEELLPLTGNASCFTELTERPVVSKNASKNKKKKKSFVVSENSFINDDDGGAVPDTVYAKGTHVQAQEHSSSGSDDNDVVLLSAKPKRLNKRKAPARNDLSDISSSSEEETDEITPSQEVRNNFPYLVRGEALGKPKKAEKRKKSKPKRTPSISKSDKTSDEEFLTKLTSICNEGEPDLEEAEEDLDSSRESVDARDIVQSVLQRRKKRLKISDEPADATSNEWIVKDQIGETDDVTFLNVESGVNKNNESDVPVDANAIEIPAMSAADASIRVEDVPRDDIRGFESVKSNPSVGQEIGWNEEMSSFYNDSWGGETFSQMEVQHRMPRKYKIILI